MSSIDPITERLQALVLETMASHTFWSIPSISKYTIEKSRYRAISTEKPVHACKPTIGAISIMNSMAQLTYGRLVLLRTCILEHRGQLHNKH